MADGEPNIDSSALDLSAEPCELVFTDPGTRKHKELYSVMNVEVSVSYRVLWNSLGVGDVCWHIQIPEETSLLSHEAIAGCRSIVKQMRSRDRLADLACGFDCVLKPFDTVLSELDDHSIKN